MADEIKFPPGMEPPTEGPIVFLASAPVAPGKLDDVRLLVKKKTARLTMLAAN
jgi:hypothetical protein